MGNQQAQAMLRDNEQSAFGGKCKFINKGIVVLLVKPRAASELHQEGRDAEDALPCWTPAMDPYDGKLAIVLGGSAFRCGQHKGARVLVLKHSELASAASPDDVENAEGFWVREHWCVPPTQHVDKPEYAALRAFIDKRWQTEIADRYRKYHSHLPSPVGPIGSVVRLKRALKADADGDPWYATELVDTYGVLMYGEDSNAGVADAQNKSSSCVMFPLPFNVMTMVPNKLLELRSATDPSGLEKLSEFIIACYESECHTALGKIRELEARIESSLAKLNGRQRVGGSSSAAPIVAPPRSAAEPYGGGNSSSVMANAIRECATRPRRGVVLCVGVGTKK